MAERVLIVEDDATAAGLLARGLQRHGYAVQRAGSVAQALALGAAWSPQAAVVDLRLAGESGLTLVPLLTQRHAGIRILVLTGYASIATAVRAIKLGAADYLAKPAPLTEIVAALGGAARADAPGHAPSKVSPARPTVRRIEWEYIQQVLAEHHGNISQTARVLGMQRRTLQRKLCKRPSGL